MSKQTVTFNIPSVAIRIVMEKGWKPIYPCGIVLVCFRRNPHRDGEGLEAEKKFRNGKKIFKQSQSAS